MVITFWIILIFFSIVGVSSFLVGLMRLFKPGEETEMFLVLPHLDEKDAEGAVRGAICFCAKSRTRIICFPEDETTKMIVLRLQKEDPRVIPMEKEAFFSLLDQS